MSSAPQTFAAPRQSRVLEKRLWCHRLPCGRIVGELADGTLLLCVRKALHEPHRCFNPDQDLLRGTQARVAISGASIPCGEGVTESQLAQAGSRSKHFPAFAPPASAMPILEGRINE